jgi:hypothetical protein
MPAASKKIVESGLHPEPAPSLDKRVMTLANEMCRVLTDSVRESLARINDAEKNAIARLNEYVPTEPLMDSKQAAAYLKMPLRTFQAKSSPSNPLIPFCFIDGLKRFRKTSLDSWLDRIETKSAEVQL